MSEVTVSIDGSDPKNAKSSAIVKFYDGKDYMNDLDRRQAIADGRMTATDEDFRTIPFVRIKFPGRSDLVVDRMAITESIGESIGDHERFPREWAAFKAQGDQEAVGTPLSVIKTFNDGDIASLADKHIRCVETLANLPDSSLNGIGLGMRRYRDIAIAYLDAQPKAVDAATQSELETLRTQVAELMAIVTKPTRKQKEIADAITE